MAGDQAITSKVLQLWVIQGNSPPRSLGMINIATSRGQAMPRARLAGLKPSAIVAISTEPVRGSLAGTPIGPVIATGKLLAA